MRLLLLIVLLSITSAVARAQHTEDVKVISDSLRNETCRGGTLSATGMTCYRAKYSTRVTVIRRLANRLDSLERAWVPDTVYRTVTDTVWLPVGSTPDTAVARVDIAFDYTTTVSWPNGQIGSLPNGSGLLCALVDVGGTPHLGDRAVNAQVVAQDSIHFDPATFASSAALRQACAPLFPGFPVATMPVWRTLWTYSKVRFADFLVAIPTAQGQKP